LGLNCSKEKYKRTLKMGNLFKTKIVKTMNFIASLIVIVFVSISVFEIIQFNILLKKGVINVELYERLRGNAFYKVFELTMIVVMFFFKGEQSKVEKEIG
jgi:hypothetical protein